MAIDKAAMEANKRAVELETQADCQMLELLQWDSAGE